MHFSLNLRLILAEGGEKLLIVTKSSKPLKNLVTVEKMIEFTKIRTSDYSTSKFCGKGIDQTLI